MTDLTEMKKADREKMAAMVEDLCRSKGAVVSRVDPGLCDPKELSLDIGIGLVRVTIDFDGSKGKSEYPDVYCMAWNTMTGSGASMSEDFGRAVGAQVNPHHRAKCMGFADGMDELLERLAGAMDCVNEDRAYDVTTVAIAA